MARLSGLQKQVLALYRAALRASRAKQQQGGESIAAYARAELDRNRGMDRKDMLRIEHLIRKGRRQLELFSSAEVTAVHVRPAPGSASAAATAGKPAS